MPDSPTDLRSEAPVARPSRPDGPPGAWQDSLPGFLAVIRQRRWTLLATSLLVPLCAGLILQQVTPLYTATGELIYQASDYQNAARQEPITEAVMASQAEVLQSLRIAQRVAERGNLFADSIFNASLRPPGPLHRAWATLTALLGLEDDEAVTPVGPSRNRSIELTLLAVQAALHAAPVKFSHVLQVTFTAGDPIVAANGANNAMDAYIKGLYADRHRKVDEVKRQFEDQARTLRETVRQAEEKIAQYRASHALSQGIHAGTDTEQITRLLEALDTARAELAGADGKLDAARGQRGAAAQAAVAPSVVQLRAQQERLAAELQAVQGRLGSAHPEVQGLNRQLAEGQRAVAAETARVVASIEADQHAAAERVRSLEAALQDTETAAERAAREQIPLNAMNRDLEAARTQLQSVLDRTQQVAHQTWIEFPEAHEISQAIPPERPSAPKTIPILAAASAAGVFIGLLLVYILHLTDDTIHSGDELRAMTGLPCYAAIPQVGRRALGHLAIDEYATRRPLTAFAEHIRSVRAALSLSADRPVVVAVTAARPAEGKSLLTVSLGRSAQLSGERVLAVGCDVRQPVLQLASARGPVAGLLDILRGTIDWQSVVQNDPLTGMHVIPAGKPGGDVAGFFLSEDMRRLLADVRARYDLVLLDAPPVEVVTDARIVAALADATLMCVRWRWTCRAELHHALDVLYDSRARVIGTVLTRVDPRAHLRSGSPDAGMYHRRYRAHDRG
ncbi:GumC family protein [Rhodopila globiformis]|uniref:AAA domain-containing protein n=1 Tax=Rhodopila globiformis TaxID=1071 RepID=A0A2S6MYC3_RHOGL|nr:hypothetical protein [Rhodopila globiformis]PPQ27358.1 hypothetical protein CCS01_27820 [Rhodopila globiformis]